MRLTRSVRASASPALLTCLALAAAASPALAGVPLARVPTARVHTKPCKRIKGCAVQLVPPPGIAFTGGPLPVVSHFGVAVKPAPNSTTGTGSQPGTLVTNQLTRQAITCQGYTQRSSATLAFKLLTATPLKINYVVTDTLTNTTPNGIELCLAAPFAFKTLSGKPAAPTKLPDGTPGFVGLLPGCANVPDTAPCLISVTTAPDPNGSSSGVDVILTARVPTTTKGGDPWAGP